MHKQTLKQAIHLGRTGKDKALARALGYLDGCPTGAWAATEQARREILGELPLREFRAYSLDQFIEAAYTIDHAGRYRPRPSDESRREVE